MPRSAPPVAAVRSRLFLCTLAFGGYCWHRRCALPHCDRPAIHLFCSAACQSRALGAEATPVMVWDAPSSGAGVAGRGPLPSAPGVAVADAAPLDPSTSCRGGPGPGQTRPSADKTRPCANPACKSAVSPSQRACSRACASAIRPANTPVCRRPGCTRSPHRPGAAYCSLTCRDAGTARPKGPAQSGSADVAFSSFPRPECRNLGCHNAPYKRGADYCSLSCRPQGKNHRGVKGVDDMKLPRMQGWCHGEGCTKPAFEGSSFCSHFCAMNAAVGVRKHSSQGSAGRQLREAKSRLYQACVAKDAVVPLVSHACDS
jgi:hypothetical protein